MPGRITYLWFYPDKPLETQVVCMEFCGAAHAQMTTGSRPCRKPNTTPGIAKHKKTAGVGPAIKVAGQSSTQHRQASSRGEIHHDDSS